MVEDNFCFSNNLFDGALPPFLQSTTDKKTIFIVESATIVFIFLLFRFLSIFIRKHQLKFFPLSFISLKWNNLFCWCSKRKLSFSGEWRRNKDNDFELKSFLFYGGIRASQDSCIIKSSHSFKNWRKEWRKKLNEKMTKKQKVTHSETKWNKDCVSH